MFECALARCCERSAGNVTPDLVDHLIDGTTTYRSARGAPERRDFRTTNRDELLTPDDVDPTEETNFKLATGKSRPSPPGHGANLTPRRHPRHG